MGVHNIVVNRLRRGGNHAADSQVLRRLAAYSIDHKAIVIGAWLLAAIALNAVVPQLEAVVRKQAVDPIPASVASLQALTAMGEAFHEPGAAATAFVVMGNPKGIDGAARTGYDRLVARLRAQPEHVQSVRDLLSDPIAAKQVVSADGKAWWLPLGLTGHFGGPDAAEAIDAVRVTAEEVFDGSGTVVHVTGPAATFADQTETAEADLLVISIATLILIGLILLVVYRSVVTALLPLLVIGASLAVARGMLAALGTAGLPISQYSTAFLTAILLGAGTDYSVFVIGRYHERIRAGESPADAVVAATASIGRVVLASALTVALALMAMVFADLSAFKTVGPACAIAIMVTCAASLTLLQPALMIAARRGHGLPRTDLTATHWRRVGALVVRRPQAMLASSVVVLVALSLIALGMVTSYDDRAGQPADTDSNQGYALLDAHFPKDIAVSQFVLVSAPQDLRTATGLADLDQMAARIAQLPGVTRVVGVTRPTGERLTQARLSWQNGEIGKRLGTAVAEGEARKSDLELLRSGSRQLAAALSELRRRVDTELAPLIGAVDGAADTAQALRTYRPWVRQLAQVAPQLDDAAQIAPAAATARDAGRAVAALEPALRALEGAGCAGVPVCAPVRTHLRQLVELRRAGFFNQVAALADGARRGERPIGAMATDLDRALASMDTQLAAVAGMNVAQRFAELRVGIGQLADGSAQLAAGVSALVDSTMETLTGMGQVAATLRLAATQTAGSEAASGFYLPAAAYENRDFATVARQFISPDGRTVRYAVQADVDPYSPAAVELSNRIAEVAEAARPNTRLAGATVRVAGFPAINADLQELVRRDFRLLAILTLLIVGVILMVLLRSVVAPIYLVATVILNYTAALGLGVLLFQHILGQAIFWPVPVLAFIILVAVGADYNMLLVSRLREESAAGLRVGVMRTVASTGAVITSAGLIFAASMFGLMAGSVGLMVQTGFIIGMGLLLDTFVVRTLTVPAIATMLGEVSWWPGGRPTRAVAGG
ncbi:MMPL/RND family transporter [Gordonia crocea]|uniref:Putative membrane protein, MmpL family n=1 Tax=Gordonia crocea TaxID=589162 RepID=A0A7M3STR6_9ACTN|nr:RND family transporter [Gordonia crocea]GED96040.1 putative membrane protein, MmpL family [Gordonia crocea]